MLASKANRSLIPDLAFLLTFLTAHGDLMSFSPVSRLNLYTETPVPQPSLVMKGDGGIINGDALNGDIPLSSHKRLPLLWLTGVENSLMFKNG